MFTELARTRGDHPALVGATRTVTYAELEQRGNRVANALRDLGVGEGDRVAYLDLNNPEFFEVMVGAAKIGAAIAPLNFRLTPGEMGRLVHDARATVLVVGPVFEAAGDRRGVRGRARGIRVAVVGERSVDEQSMMCEELERPVDRRARSLADRGADVVHRPRPVEQRQQSREKAPGGASLQGDERASVLDEHAGVVLDDPAPGRKRRSCRDGRWRGRHQQRWQQRTTVVQRLQQLELHASSSTA